MIRSYLISALRNMRRQPGYAALNVVGLAVGLACALLIILFVADELAHDRQHPDHVYRVTSEAATSGDVMRVAVTPARYAPALAAESPAVAAFCRVHPALERMLLRHGDVRIYEEGVVFADSSFFDVFGFSLAQGDERSALVEPFSIVLTPDLAARLFSDDDPVGRAIVVSESQSYTVTGVLDEDPVQTHLDFDAVASFSTTEALAGVWEYGPDGGFLNSWHLAASYSYVRLRSDADPAEVADHLTAIVSRNVSESQASYEFGLQPITDVHLRSDFLYDPYSTGDIAYVYIFSVVALFVLAIAGINYMNLATARSARRATEVGIRKVLGADRRRLAGQFLTESSLTAFLALGVALALAAIAMPLFNSLAGKTFTSDAVLAPSVLAWLVPCTAIVGLVSGVYPALVLSRFDAAPVLKQARGLSGGSAFVRRVLVVFQFVATVTLLIGTAVVHRQLQYVSDKDLGYDPRNLVTVQVPDAPTSERIETIKTTMEEHAAVLSAAASSGVPVGGAWRHDTRPGGTPEGERWLMAFYGVDYDFIETVGFDIVAGRSFMPNVASDSIEAYIVNEAAAARLGWHDAAVGRDFAWFNPHRGLQQGRVIGVVRDFHFDTFREPIEPAFFAIAPRWTNVLTIRIAPDDQAAALAHIQRAWASLFPGYPLEYEFLDEGWGEATAGERRFGHVFALFTALTLLVACLGLFGLASYAAEQRRKEVGVRKVMGASTRQIVLLLTKDAMVLVGAAFLLAAPLSFVLMRRWLSDFAYRTDVSGDVFLAAGLVVVAVAFVTVGWQALRAATADPARALRYE